MAFKDQNPSSLGPIQQGQWAAVWIPILRGMVQGIIQNSTGGGTTLPDQDGHSGEVLSTNGTNLSWIPVPVPGIDTVLAQGEALTAGRDIDSTGQFFSITSPRAFRVGDSAGTGNGVLFTVSGTVGAAGEYIGLQAPSIRYKNTSDFILDINAESLTADRVRTEPDKDGTYAMTSDLGGTVDTSTSYGHTLDLSALIFPIGIYDYEFTGSTGATSVLLPVNTNAPIGTIIIIGDLDAIALTSNITIDAGVGNQICGTTLAQTFVMNISGQCITLKKITNSKWKVQ